MSASRPLAGLAGRDEELQTLKEEIEKAGRGTGGMVWLIGDGGIGKSRLASAAAELARERGLSAKSAAADEFERHRPFAVIASCLGLSADTTDEHRRRAAGLLASAARSGGELELGIGEALLAAVEDLCARAPALLVLDDLQWADDSSLELVGRLTRSVSELPLLVLCTARRQPRRESLHRVLAVSRELGAHHLSLEPLDPDAAEELAADLAGAAPGENLRAQIKACGGKPLFVRVLIEALRAEGLLQVHGERVESRTAAPPPSLDSTILGRLSSLTGETVDVLRLASILGSAFTLRDLSLLTGQTTQALWTPLRDAFDAGVLVEEEPRLRFAHDLVREALYRDLPAAVRDGLHLDLARAMAARNAPPVAVAEHLLRGAQPGDREAVAWLERAAGEVAPRGAAAAAELLEAAFRLADAKDPARGRVMVALGLSRIAAGRREAGEQVCRRALAERAAPEREGALRLAVARSLIERGRPAEALAEAAQVASSPGVTSADRAFALSMAVYRPLFTHQLDGAQAAAEAALNAGEEAGSAAVVAFALTRLGHLAAFRGEFSEQERLAARALEAAVRDASSEAHHLSHAHLNYAFALADLDRTVEGIETVAAGRRAYEQLGMEETLRNSHHYAGYPLFLAGQWEDTLAEIETAVALSEEFRLGWTVDVLSLQAVILARRDELPTAAALADRAQAAQAAGAPEFRMRWTAWARALIDEARGDHVAARERLWEAWESVSTAGVLGEQRAFAPDLARMLQANREQDRLARVAEDVERLAERNPGLRSLEALARRCRALAAANVAGLLDAYALYPPQARPHEKALAGEDAAVALAAAGERDRANRLARETLALYASLGAARDAARATARLRAAGLRLGARGPRRRELRGWGSLTASERRVAELAADGLSNPQIAERLVVSRHTVATHVKHILGKLELRSRHELARARPPA